MKKYLVVYTAPTGAMENMTADSEEAKAEMNKWKEWMEKVGSGMVDMGAPLGSTVKLTKDGSSEEKSNVVGYSILQAENMDEVKKLLEGHPHLGMPGSCEIEVHEALPVPGME